MNKRSNEYIPNKQQMSYTAMQLVAGGHGTRDWMLSAFLCCTWGGVPFKVFFLKEKVVQNEAEKNP